jgi:hypothetical protein
MQNAHEKMKLRQKNKGNAQKLTTAIITAGFVAVAGLLLLTSRAAQNPAADLNGDGQVSILDLSILLGNWGKSGTGLKGDINSDNSVTISDLSILLSSWGPVSTPSPSPPLSPTSWQSAFDSRNQATLDAWYKANTGYVALGYDSASFLDISSDNIVDQAWLTAKNGNGHVSQSNGRWLVEKVRSSRIRIAADNVTVRGCLVSPSGSNVYGVQHYPTWTNAVTGTVVEHCTINGGGSEGTGILLAGTATGETTAIARNNDVYGWGTGIQMYGDITVEYNRAHDLHYYTGSHNAAASNRGANVRISRNSLEDGSSSALSLYADDLIHNMVVEQNIFNTPRANYCVNFPSSKEYFSQTYDTHLRNNIFGQVHNPKCGSSGPMAGGNWTTISGNFYMDGTPVLN